MLTCEKNTRGNEVFFLEISADISLGRSSGGHLFNSNFVYTLRICPSARKVFVYAAQTDAMTEDVNKILIPVENKGQ
jgi:hypothetical protein